MISRRNLLGVASVTAATTSLMLPRRARAASGSPRAVLARDGAEIHVKDWGSGSCVVLSHGWPLNADSWDSLACVLVDAGYRVIAHDRRGCGRSSQAARGYDYDTFAADLESVLKALNVRDATLVGYSMGGGEVVRYLARYGSKRVRKLALVAAALPYLSKTRDNPAGVDPLVFEDLKRGLLGDRPAFLDGLMRDVIYDTSIQGRTAISEQTLMWSRQMGLQAGLLGLLACVDTFGKTDLRADLAAIDVPTLILHGTLDKPVPFALAQLTHARIASSKLIEYVGASHGILVSERERVAKDLLAFIA